MSKRWHSNKTQPNFKQHIMDDIIVIWNNKDVTISGIDVNDHNELYLIDYGYNNPLWKDAKQNIVKWAYVNEYFNKELNSFEKVEQQW